MASRSENFSLRLPGGTSGETDYLSGETDYLSGETDYLSGDILFDYSKNRVTQETMGL